MENQSNLLNDQLVELVKKSSELVNKHPELSALKTLNSLLENEIKGIEFKKESCFRVPNFVEYEKKSKSMLIGKIKDGVDYNCLTLKELVQSVLPANANKTALNSGFAAMYSTLVVGDESEIDLFVDEKTIVNLLTHIVGFDAMCNYVIHGKNDIFAILNNMGIKENEIKEVLDEMNRNIGSKLNGRTSNLDEIQIKLIDMFFKNPELTKENVENFESNLITGDQNSSNYKNLGTVKNHFISKIAKVEFGKDFEVGAKFAA